MTDKLYTQSDMEALRERCAKELDRRERENANTPATKAAYRNAARALRATPLHPEGQKP